jgi:DNA-binding transcriptional regulator YiaG
MTIRINNPLAAPSPERQVVDEFDATALVGLKVKVCKAARVYQDDDGETVYNVPNLRGLQAASAVARCLMPIKLRGAELRAMRKLMRLTLAGLAERLDAKTAPETISRWESEAQPMGGYAEKVFRLLVCDALHKEAPGIGYDGSKIAQLRVLDPWLMDKSFEVPYLKFQIVKVKEGASGNIVDAWDAKMAA